VVLQKVTLASLECGRSEFYFRVVFHPNLQPTPQGVSFRFAVVDAYIFLDGLFQFFFYFCLRLAEDIFDDGFARLWIVTECVPALPTSVLALSDVPFPVCLQFLKYGHRLITDIDKKLCLKLRAIQQVSYQTCIVADLRPRLFSANQAVNKFCLRNHIFAASFLPLHSACAITAHKLGHIGNTDAVEVADDRVLQAARRHGELECGLLVLIVVETVE